ncbi:MAG: acyl-CoA dehydrogenase [Dehalococcoidia bacterium]|nr:acyl-CoA dehydrogenase [Dehalococcoidia bacterium]MSQ16182.1 acyl-CoA dehydrogenase [Dehalococcoidia bacterium]
MEFKFSPEDDAFRRELRAFVLQELPPDWEGGGRWPEEVNWELTRQMRRKLAQRGWLTMHWPKEYGGQNASPVRSAIYNEELAYLRAPGRDIFGVRMLGPTLMLYGSEEQKRTYLPPIAQGEIQWCQGFSEPEAGSDLASLNTRAVRDGDDYVINGAKIWTTLGHRADAIFVLARTDTDAPKHRGISFILADMKTPGIQVRPIVNMANGHEFNQVIFDNVRVPRRNLVGEENRGWYVAVTLLDFERSGIDYSAIGRRLLDEMLAYTRDTVRNGQPLVETPWVRHLLADRYIECEVARLMAYNVAYMQEQGLVPTKEASMSKVFGSETLHRVAASCLEILGPYGALGREEKWAPLKGRVQEHWMISFSHQIAAGTSEVQRNIIAGRGLGLPRG